MDNYRNHFYHPNNWNNDFQQNSLSEMGWEGIKDKIYDKMSINKHSGNERNNDRMHRLLNKINNHKQIMAWQKHIKNSSPNAPGLASLKNSLADKQRANRFSSRKYDFN